MNGPPLAAVVTIFFVASLLLLLALDVFLLWKISRSDI